MQQSRIGFAGINVSPKVVTVIMIFLCFGLMSGCSAEVNGPEWNFPGGWQVADNVDFQAQKSFETEVAIENQLRVQIEAINGEVVVTGDGNADTVRVTAQQFVGSHSQQDADLHIDDLESVVTSSGDEIIIRTDHPRTFSGRQYRVQYNIVVPSSFEVITTQVNGRVQISDIENNVDVSNTNGNIVLSNIVGGATADVVNGNIDAAVTLPLNRAIDLFADNGNIGLSIPLSTSARLDAAVVHGTIDSTDIALHDAVQDAQSLTGTFGSGEGLIELWAVNGNIRIVPFLNGG